MSQDDGKVIRTPSEHPLQYVVNVADQVYKVDAEPYVEQSAIYQDVPFVAQERFKSLGIVLSAQCDIERFTDNSYLLVARIQPIAGAFGLWLEEEKGYTEAEILGDTPVDPVKKKRRRVCEKFAKTYLRNKVVKYYFLPELLGVVDASFVCCEITQCIQVKEIEKLKKVCVLRSPFREAVPAHYAAYIGRVGTPVFKKDDLLATLDTICKIQESN